jgi:hypothetical protein
MLTLGSLPLSFTTNAELPTDVALVGPDDRTIAKGIAERPRIIVIDQPASISSSSLSALEQCGIPVLPVLEVAPTLAPCLSLLPLPETTLIRSSLHSSGESSSGRLEHILALEFLLGPLSDLHVLSDDGTAYWASARASKSNARVLYNGRSGTGWDRLDLDVLGIAQHVEVAVSYSPTAKPASIRIGDRDGTKELRGRFESGLRLFWRQVAAVAAGDQAAAISLNAATSARLSTPLF